MQSLFESLETRNHLDATFGAAGDPLTWAVTARPVITFASNTPATITKKGTLLINGTSQNDEISLSTTPPKGNDMLQIISKPGVFSVYDPDNKDELIYITQRRGAVTTHTAARVADVKRIYIEGGAGNDNLSIDASVKRPGTLIGAAGNDTLTGGVMGDVLSGGAGNDTLNAGPSQRNVFSLVEFAKPEQKPVGGKLFIPGQKQTGVTLISNAKLVDISKPEREDSADLLDGGKGDDTITSGRGPDTIIGGAGNDTLNAPGRGDGVTVGVAGEVPTLFDGLTVSSVETLNPVSPTFLTGVRHAGDVVNFRVGTTVVNG